MHVIIVTDDVLYPTNSGGRSAQLGECEALIAAGCEVTLVISHRNEISAEDKALHERLAVEVVFVQRTGFAKTTASNPLRPYQLHSRRTLDSTVAVGLGRPDTVGVIAAHEWTIPLAKSIAGPLGLQVVLRSHNDEVRYMHALSKSASGVRRLYCWAEAVRLHAMLKRLYGGVSGVAVLSQDDAASYRAFGHEPVFVPAVLFRETDVFNPLKSPPRNPDLLFVGALDMPQAVQGLRWFCRHVLPQIRAAIPTAILHVAGRRSDSELSAYLSSQSGITFHGEVEELEGLYARSRVFINPVFSGSGVNMKVGPPASRGIPVVTTSMGARGLDHLAPAFQIADDEHNFALRCKTLLKDDAEWQKVSQELQRRSGLLSPDAIARSLLATFAVAPSFSNPSEG